MAAEYDWLLAAYGRGGDAQSLLRLGQKLESDGQLDLAAAAYDRAFGLSPGSEPINAARHALLDRLAIVAHGITFRYIPAGTFVMGSDTGEPDEGPAHPVRLDKFWLSDSPVSWAAYCDLTGWQPPPYAAPTDDGTGIEGDGESTGRSGFFLREENKIRMQYCEDATTGATDWHAHAPEHQWHDSDGPISSRILFGSPAREDPRRPWRYDRKPMVSVSWLEAEEMCAKMRSDAVRYQLPTEAQWEKAARGGLIGCAYPWGNDPPADDRCDFNRFDQFSILPMRRFARNGYGLYAMSGCVWEWTSDWYDAKYYSESQGTDPVGPAKGGERVLRGGSWADCAEAVTVSFRMSRKAGSWRAGDWGGHFTPNVGFRLCRVVPNSPQ
jgi:formylglycine-generating enzyme required for sulfatase activity